MTPPMPRFANHRTLASHLRDYLAQANRRKRPGGSAPVLVEAPRVSMPLAKGAAAALACDA